MSSMVTKTDAPMEYKPTWRYMRNYPQSTCEIQCMETRSRILSFVYAGKLKRSTASVVFSIKPARGGRSEIDAGFGAGALNRTTPLDVHKNEEDDYERCRHTAEKSNT